MKEKFEWLNYIVLDAPVWSWLLFLLAWVVIYLALRLMLVVAKKRLKKMAEARRNTEELEEGKARETAELNRFQIFYQVLDRTMRLTIAAAAVMLAMLAAPGLPDDFETTMFKIAVAMLILQVGIWGMAYIDSGIQRTLMLFNVSETATKTAMGVLKFFALILLWTGIVILILDNLGVEIGPLIAGLGIGGIAVAFALQKILADIFCSVAIVLDRPFEVGDFVILDTVMGTIERIGIKTTRIRSLSGQQIIVSNADLTNSRINNYKRMPQRRVVFTFTVPHQTPVDQAEKIGGWVKDIIVGIDQTRFDRAHLKGFGASSYDYEVVYYVSVSDYNVYMDIQQEINLAMIRKFNAENVAFAYPTQTLYVQGLPQMEVRHITSRSEYGGEQIAENNLEGPPI